MLTSNATELKEIIKIKNLQADVYFEVTHFFYCHMTSFVTGSVLVKHCAVGAKTMHSLGTELIRNLAIWLVENLNWVN